MPNSATHESIRQSLEQVRAAVAMLTAAGLERAQAERAQAELAELKAAAAPLLDQDQFALIGLISDRSEAWREYRTKLDRVREFLQTRR